MLPWFQFITFHLGPIPIRVWGLFVALGMVVSLLIVLKSKRVEHVAGGSLTKGERQTIADAAIWAIMGGLIGARLYHVLFYEPVFYFSNPLEIFKVWHGGLSSFGGLFGAAVGYLLFFKTRKLKFKIYHLKFADALAYSAVYGWMIGRLGCVMIHDHPGVPCNCFLSIRWPDGTARLDMALVEIILMTPLGIWFYIKTKHSKNPSPSRGGKGGVTEGWYLNILLIYYGTLRFILDFFRATDVAGADVRYLGLTPAQYFSVVLVIIGARFFWQGKGKGIRAGANIKL